MNNRVIELQLPESSGARYFLLLLDRISKEEIDQAVDLLNEDDLRKARKFMSEKDCHQCLQVYTLTKKILGNLLGKDPTQLSFSRNPFGKPYLQGHPLHFNLSHSDIYAFLGVHPTHPIGVDIEKTRKSIPLDSFLYPSEIAALYHPPTLLWAAKEAYVKALGIGFSQSLPILKPIYFNELGGRSYFISRISTLFPPLLVKGYNKIINNYNLATCINK